MNTIPELWYLDKTNDPDKIKILLKWANSQNEGYTEWTDKDFEDYHLHTKSDGSINGQRGTKYLQTHTLISFEYFCENIAKINLYNDIITKDKNYKYLIPIINKLNKLCLMQETI
jgi:hypothetical protein